MLSHSRNIERDHLVCREQRANQKCGDGPRQYSEQPTTPPTGQRNAEKKHNENRALNRVLPGKKLQIE